MAKEVGTVGSLNAHKAGVYVLFSASKKMRVATDGVTEQVIEKDVPTRLPEAYAKQLVEAERGKIVAAPKGDGKKAGPKGDADKDLKAAIVELMKLGKAALVAKAMELGLYDDKKAAEGEAKEALAQAIAEDQAPDDED